MNRKITKFLLSIALISSFCSIAFGQADWMSANSAILGKKQINEIGIPGAHDAGSYTIDRTKYKGGIFGSKVATSPDTKPLKQLFARGTIVPDWSKTQERTALEMLNDGIRYFDLRICVDAKGILMTCHGLYGASLEMILDDVVKFAEKNPKEIILLGFNHFWDREFQIANKKKEGEIEGLRSSKWLELTTLVKQKLAGKLIDGKKFSPKSKLQDFWQASNAKESNQIILLFDTADVSDDPYIWKQKEENTWFPGWDIDAFKARTFETLENAKNRKYADKFWAIRSSITPDESGKLIGLGIFSNVYPKSASELADMTNPIALGWMKNEWAGKYTINLIWSDFYNRHDLVKLAKHLNGIKVDFANTKIGTDTNWTRWKTSRN